MELNVTVPGKKSSSKVELSDSVFACEYNEALIHQVVTSFLAGLRAGTKAQKGRAEVRGGGKKPWRQKGTGRARAGSIRSPIWRGGGKVFAAKTRDFSQKINKKMYRGAMRSILSELVRQNCLVVLEPWTMEKPNTKALLSTMQQLDLKNVLLISHEVDENLYLSARNVHTIDVRDAQDIDPFCLLKYEKVAVTQPALKQLEEWLG